MEYEWLSGQWILSKPVNRGYSLKTSAEYKGMWRTAEDIWRVLVCRPIGTPDGLIARVSSGVPGAELTLWMQQV